MSLVEEAKKIVKRKSSLNLPVGNEAQELALTWLKGEISNKQVLAVIKIDGGANFYTFICKNLRESFQSGKLVIKE